MSFATDKAAALEKLKAFGCDLVPYIDAILTGYDKVYAMFVTLLKQYECYPQLMTDMMTAFDNASLIAQGIYVGGVHGTITDGKIFVNATVTTATYAVPPGDLLAELIVAGSSVINSLYVIAGGTVGMLSVTDGARVKVIGTGEGAIIDILRVTGCNGLASTVETIDSTGTINQIKVDGDGFVGAISCLDPTLSCGDEVSDLTFNKVTAESLLLNWTAAASSVRTVVYYRLNNTPVWLHAGVDNGDGVKGNYATDGTTGYSFRGLKIDTYYDFKVVNICSNGIASAGTTATQKTTGLASSSGGGSGPEISGGSIQFTAVGGETETTDASLIGASSVDVFIGGQFIYPGTDPMYLQYALDNVAGTVAYSTPLIADQQVLINIKVMLA